MPCAYGVGFKMDIPRKDASRKRLIRRILIFFLLAVVVAGTGFGLKRLKPAAPGVDLSVVYKDTVKRGPMIREVRGLGTLVPEETMLIPATTEGRVQSILIRPGTNVTANSVVMVLTSPELETQTLDAEYLMKAAEAELQNLMVTLKKGSLDLLSNIAQINADYSTARLQADRDAALAKEGLFSELDAKISAVKAQELKNRLDLQQQRLTIDGQEVEAQVAAQQVKVEEQRG